MPRPKKPIPPPPPPPPLTRDQCRINDLEAQNRLLTDGLLRVQGLTNTAREHVANDQTRRDRGLYLPPAIRNLLLDLTDVCQEALDPDPPVRRRRRSAKAVCGA